MVPEFDLRPLLYKRLRIQGSTLRARSEDYQAELVARFKREAFEHITGADGNGLIRTYIHKVWIATGRRACNLLTLWKWSGIPLDGDTRCTS